MRAKQRIFLAAVMLLGLAACQSTQVRKDTASAFDIGVAAHDRGDYATAFREFRQLAEHGTARAQNILGFMYEKGQGVLRDYRQAERWYRRAAEQGLADSQGNLGAMYAEGLGVTRDFEVAVKWYHKAAEQGDARAQNNLGVMYAGGKGVVQDHEAAARWYRKAAEQGDARAQNNLGFMYANGRGVPQNYREAERWWRRAAEQGLAISQYNLGVTYSKGRGVSHDYAEAAKWYRKAAEQGLAAAQYNLGAMYANGQGVPRDHTEAARWWRIASGLGFAEAQIALDRQMQWGIAHPVPPDRSTPATLEKVSAGSGFVVSRSGYVLTNQHVVEGCRRVRGSAGAPVETAGISMRPKAGTGFEPDVLQVVGVDAEKDLALLKGEGKTPAPATFRGGHGVRAGEDIIVTGFPLPGLLSTDLNITKGSVSALAGPGNNRSLIQLTAPIQPGNSGGPVLDLSGHLVGVVVARLDALKLARRTGILPQNVNFAVSAGTARAFLDAHGVDYETAPSTAKLDPAQIADQARGFTVLVECWK